MVSEYQEKGFFDPRPGLVFAVECEIDTNGSTPYRANPRPMNKPKKTSWTPLSVKLMKDDIIEPCSSPEFLSCPVLVKKKTGRGKPPNWRLCVDYRVLNSKTKPRPHVMPRIDYVLSQLGKAMVFTTIDLSQGFHQFAKRKADRDKTAFGTPHRGSYRYKRMPFDLKNACFTFQSVMDKVLDGALYKYCMAFIDDVVIYSNNWADHARHLADVFERLERAGFTVNPNKVHIGCQRIKLLGHIVEPGKVSPDPEKVRAINQYPAPVCVKGIQRFLGAVGFYRAYIELFSKLAAPLSNSLKDGVDWSWGLQEHEFRLCQGGPHL